MKLKPIRPTERADRIGFDFDARFRFTAVLLYSFYITSLVAVGNTTMDAFAVTVLHQYRTQLAAVRCVPKRGRPTRSTRRGSAFYLFRYTSRSDFESLPERARSSAQRSGRNFEAVLYELFVDSLVHYKKIIE